MKKNLKKAVSMLVAVCLIVGIANIPAYAKVSTISTVKTTDAVLSKAYVTPSQAAKNALKSAKPTAKVAATKKATKASVNKVVNQTLSLINKLLKNKKLSKTAQKWLKAAKKKVNKLLNSTNITAAKEALSLIKAVKKAKCSSLSLVKATVTGKVFKSLKSTLSKDKNYKLYRKYAEKAIKAIDNLLKKNGLSQAVKTWLTKAKTLVTDKMFGKGSISTKTKWLKKALASINNVVKKNASNEVLRQESGKGKVFSSLSKLVPADTNTPTPTPTPVDPVNPADPTDPVDPVNPADPVDPVDHVNPSDPVDPVNPSDPVEPTPVEKPYQQNLDTSIALINTLKNNENTSDVAKSWLNAAQATINEIANSDKTDAEKEELIANALASIQNVANNNCSMEVLEQESSNGIFGSLQETVLENNTEYQNYQINNTYSQENVEVINSLATTSGLSKYQIFQQFKNAGVTDEQFAAVAQTIQDKANAGETFVNGSAVALSKYLNINEKLAVIQQLAVAIANGSNINNNLSGSSRSISLEDMAAVAKLNGDNVSDTYNYSIEDFMATLRDGESAVLYTNPSRTIMVVKQNDNAYDIIDYGFIMNGKPAIGKCNAEEFKDIMNGKKVSIPFHLDPSFGFSYSANYDVWYNNSNGKLNFVSNSKGIKEAEETILNEEYVEPVNTIINNLLNAEGTSDLAKQWLNKAKEIVTSVINDNDNVSNEKAQLKEILASVERVAQQNASIAVLLQESTNDSVFASLKEEVLNKDENVKNVIAPVFEQYAKPIISTIKNLSNGEDLTESAQIWLNGARNLICEVVNEIENKVNSGNNDFSQQQAWLERALTSIENVQNENASIQVLIQETAEGSAFEALKDALENSTTYKSYIEYGETGDNVISMLSKKLNVVKDVVYNIFSKVMEVTKEQIDKAGPLVLSLMERGEKFINCAAVAVGAYLNINRNLAAIMNLAAYLSTDADYFVSNNQNGFQGTTSVAEIKSLQKNGYENAKEIRFETIENFMGALQVGESSIFSVYCYDLGGHAIMVKKEANGFGVVDINRNNGEEVIYTPENFITLMTGANGTTVQGLTTDGKTFSANVYYTAITNRTQTQIVYENGSANITFLNVPGVYIITDSENAFSLAA